MIARTVRVLSLYPFYIAELSYRYDTHNPTTTRYNGVKYLIIYRLIRIGPATDARNNHERLMNSRSPTMLEDGTKNFLPGYYRHCPF